MVNTVMIIMVVCTSYLCVGSNTQCWLKLKFNFLPIPLMAEILANILAHSVSKFFVFLFFARGVQDLASSTKIFFFHQSE